MSPVLAFASMVAVLTLAPGPDVLLVLRTALSRGRGPAIAAAVGVCTALAGWGCAAAFGVTAVLTAAPALYIALRWAGIVYLSYLGIRLLLGRGGGQDQAAGAPEHGQRSLPDRRLRCRSYLRGVLTNASNPKVGAFYLSLLPQFIPPGTPVLGYSLLLASVHVAESLGWLALIALLAGQLGQSLRRPAIRRWLDRLSGAVFVGFAARLAFQG